MGLQPTTAPQPPPAHLVRGAAGQAHDIRAAQLPPALHQALLLLAVRGVHRRVPAGGFWEKRCGDGSADRAALVPS